MKRPSAGFAVPAFIATRAAVVVPAAEGHGEMYTGFVLHRPRVPREFPFWEFLFTFFFLDRGEQLTLVSANCDSVLSGRKKPVLVLEFLVKLRSAFPLVLFLFLAFTSSPAATVSSISLGSSIVGGSNQQLSGTVIINRGPGDTGTVFVSMLLSGGVQLIESPIFPAGVSSSSFKVDAPGFVATSQAASVTAAIGVSQQTANVTITPMTVSLSLAGSVIGGSTQTLTATVTTSAPVKGNKAITLDRNGATDFNLNPVTVTVLANQDQGTSIVSSGSKVSSSQSRTVNATLMQGITASANFTIDPFQVTVTGPYAIYGLQTAKGKVRVNAPAASTLPISYSSTPALGLSIEAFSIPANQQEVEFSYIRAGVTTSELTGTLTGTVIAGVSSSIPVKVLAGRNGDLGPECDHCGKASSPVNLSNGNVWVEASDADFPGLGGLQVFRTWNSLWETSSPVETVGTFGHSWRSNYDERLQTLTGGVIRYWRGNGASWYFSYDSITATYSVQVPANEKVTLVVDPLTSTRIVSFADGSQKIFNANGYLTTIKDRNANQTALAYDGSNRLVTVTSPTARVLTFSYVGAVRTASTLADASGTIAIYTYDASSRLTKVTYADGSFNSYVYDGANLLTTVTDTNSIVLEAHTYSNARKGLVSNRANNADKVTVAYTSATQTRVTDSKNNITDYTFSSIGGKDFIRAISGPGCNTCGGRGNQTFTFDTVGNKLSAIDAATHNSISTYDAYGNVLTRTVYLGSTPLTSTFTYNARGQVLTATDPAGNVTTNTYDANGNLLTTTTPSPSSGVAGSTTTFEYFTNGLLKKVIDPLNHATSMTYTAAGLVETITDAQSNVTTFEYDARGNRIAVVDAANNRTEFTYDVMNRLTRVTNPDSTFTQFAYDNRGRRTSVTDANNKVTTYAYDDADRLTSVTDAQTPTAGVTTYAYDTENNLTSITDALSRTTTFEYDARGRVTKTIFPSTLYETYNYDNLGNLLSKVDRKNQTITYGYDSLNRLTSKTLGSTGQVTFTYDTLGRLTQAQDAIGTYALSYDNLGRLTGTSTQYAFLPSQTFTKSYGYDAAGNRTSFTDPQSGETSYVYDTLNRLESLTSLQSQQFTFGYDNLGRRTSLSRPNGVTTSYTYDNVSRLLSVLHKDSANAIIDGATYTVDNVGNRLSKQNHLAGVTDTYTYDPIYQLTQVVQNAVTTEFYNYDKVGNRTSSHVAASYTVNSSNQLTSDANATYTFDANGNVQTKTVGTDVTSYTWDYENQLAEVTSTSAATVSFKYDPFGRRIQKSSATGTVNYLYSGGNIVNEVDAAGAEMARYAQGPGVDEPLAMLRGVTTSYYEQDGLGSVTSLTDSDGAVAASYAYDSYGQITSSIGSMLNSFRYTGRELDNETGLNYYRARYYDPVIGRFNREDPIKFAGGINFFVYTGNTPTTFNDPSGLKVQICSRTGFREVFPFGGLGNHVYLVDSRSGKNCGRGDNSGKESPSEVGTVCVDVQDSDGHEDQIMSCCNAKHDKPGPFFPGVSDCHNLAQNCVKQAGLPVPAVPGGRTKARCSGPQCTPGPTKDDLAYWLLLLRLIP
jgi:RHS repeat-associated protein